MLTLLVVDQGDRLLGSVGLHDVDLESTAGPRSATGSRAEARGARASPPAAVRLIAGHAFATLALERIGISVEVGNERLLPGRRASRVPPRGSPARLDQRQRARQPDAVMFSLLRDEAER